MSYACVIVSIVIVYATTSNQGTSNTCDCIHRAKNEPHEAIVLVFNHETMTKMVELRVNCTDNQTELDIQVLHTSL